MAQNFIWEAWSASPEGRAILESLAKNRYPQGMNTTQQKAKVRRKAILVFWKKHGTHATEDAFSVCERTLFRWQKECTPKSRAHRNGYQERVIHPLLQAKIIRLRTQYPGLGKEKLAPLLRDRCLAIGQAAPSEPTVGRMLTQLKDEGKLPTGKQLRLQGNTARLLEKHPWTQKKKLRRAGYLPEKAGDLLQVDGVLIHTLGQRRYTFTAVDLVSRWAFSKTYKTASSRNGKDFLTGLLATAPFSVSHIQTDNGSELMKEFGEAAKDASLIHFHNWVKQPKYQGWVERFNRTIQEKFLDWHNQSLALEPDQFNIHLQEWLTFYNTKRVHRSLRSSGQRLTPLQYLELTAD